MNTVRVLYFEDEKWQSDTIQKNLEESYPCYLIKVVSNVEDFLKEIYSFEEYAIIMIDIMAPMSMILDNNNVKIHFTNAQIQQMNNGLNIGEVLYEKTRKVKLHKKTPILFYSSKRGTNIKDPLTSFIQKPLLVIDIHEKIQELIKGNGHENCNNN